MEYEELDPELEAMLHKAHSKLEANLVAFAKGVEQRHLNKLREEFEEARDEKHQWLLSKFKRAVDPKYYITRYDADVIALWPDSELATAARRYIIARDYKVFDDRWEMVWKLQNNN